MVFSPTGIYNQVEKQIGTETAQDVGNWVEGQVWARAKYRTIPALGSKLECSIREILFQLHGKSEADPKEETDLKHYRSRVVKAEVPYTGLRREQAPLDRRPSFSSPISVSFLPNFVILFHFPETLTRRLLEHSLLRGEDGMILVGLRLESSRFVF